VGRLCSGIARGVLFWSVTFAQGAVYGIIPWAIIQLLLGEHVFDSSNGVQGVGEVVALLIGLALALDEATARAGWGHKVVRDYRWPRRARESPWL
jgi:hypothetical protein